MNKKLKALRMAALLGGASVLLVGASATAGATGLRLHSSSYSSYGLIPPSTGFGSSSQDASGANIGGSAANGGDTETRTTIAKNVNRANVSSGTNVADQPRIEDPPLPSYDGENQQSPSIAGGAPTGGGKGGKGGKQP